MMHRHLHAEFMAVVTNLLAVVVFCTCNQALLYIKYCLLVAMVFKTVQCIQILTLELEQQ